jgi:hypothetical protein
VIGDKNLLQMGGSIEESALVCQERNGHSMLGGQGIAVDRGGTG